MPRYSCFLSYSRKDEEIVAKYSKTLESEGLSHWVDRQQIQAGDVWEKAITQGLKLSDVCVVFVTRNILDSFVAREVAIANELRKKIIPIALDDMIESEQNLLIKNLRTLQFIDSRGRESDACLQLANAIKRNHLASVLAVYNVKGGVGKTTLTLHLGTYYYRQGKKRILLIDADPQTNLSSALVRSTKTDPQKLQQNETKRKRRGLFRTPKKDTPINVLEQLQAQGKSIYRLWNSALTSGLDSNGFDLTTYIYRLDGPARECDDNCLDILCGEQSMADFNFNASETALKKASIYFGQFLNECRRNYDLIIIDMNPSITNVANICLGASTHILSPVRPDAFSLQGLDLLDSLAGGEDGTEGVAPHCDRIIVINDPKLDDKNKIQSDIKDSKYRDQLIDATLPRSQHFWANASARVDDPLTKLPAYGNWTDSPATHRKSLKNVADAVAERVGLHL